MQKHPVEYLILRIGVAFAFLYAAVDAFIDPNSWLDYFPQFITHVAPVLTLLHIFGVVEVIIALWILSGYKIFVPSVVATLTLAAIVVFNVQEFQLLFRDLSIAAASLALAVMSSRSTPLL